LEKGVICEFKLDELKAPLSKKTLEYLIEQGIVMDAIIQFELKEVKIIDENSEAAWNYFLEVLFANCFLNALPMIGFTK